MWPGYSGKLIKDSGKEQWYEHVAVFEIIIQI